MKEIAYGAYNDLVIDLSRELIANLPEQKEKIESIIFKEAMYKWAQAFFTARSEKEISKGNVSSNNKTTLTEKELKEVGKSSPGIVEQIKAALFPDERDIPKNITAIFNNFIAKCQVRLDDYNQYWHPFYELQQNKTKELISELNSSTFFNPKANPQLSAEIMGKVWHQFVVPEVNKKIDELKQKGVKTSDANTTLAECLGKHMGFIELMVSNAKQYIATTQNQINLNSENRIKYS